MIHLENVTKLYGDVIGVNDISLSVGQGAYGLLGPNGSGKSTLLNLVTGQLRPTIGSLRVLGVSPWNNSDLFRRIGYCPSSDGLYANVSAFEWLSYLLELYRMNGSQARAAAERALELVGMTDAMHRDISGYSRGMRQRTKLAQAIAHDPELLILDEPFNGLDPVGRNEMTVALRAWIEEGKSLLLASHVLHEVESVTPSFLLICGGRLLASGTTAEVNEMFVDLPSTFTLRTSQVYPLMRRLAEHALVDSAAIDNDSVVVTTHSPTRLLNELPGWVAVDGLEITEIHSADESLQALFSTLLQIHRGEV